MKTKKKLWLITACLFCIFILQVSGLRAQNDSTPNLALAELESDNPLDYFERIEFQQFQYTLIQDEDMVIQLFKKEFVELPDDPFLIFSFQNMDDNSYFLFHNYFPLISSGVGYDGLEVYEIRINLNEINQYNNNVISVGFHLVSATLVSGWQPPVSFYVIGTLDILDYVPITEQPVIDYVNLSPSNVLAGRPGSGMDGGLSVSFEAVFSNYEEFQKANRAKLSFYRIDENERPEFLSELDVSLGKNYNRYSVYNLYNYILSFNGYYTVRRYEIKIDFNPNTPFENDYSFTLTRFEVPEPPSHESSKRVHTDYGLYNTSLIGNQDKFDLTIEGWKYGSLSSQPFYLLQAGAEIGSPGWDSKRYRLLAYEKIAGWSEGTLTATIDLSNEDAANSSVTYPIIAGNYMLMINTSSFGYVVTPITVFDGKTQITPTLTGIEVAVPPPHYKNVYKNGDKLDLSGLIVRAIYDITQGGRYITDYTTIPANGSVLTLENTSVIINYTEKGITKSTSFPIYVLAEGDWTVHQFNNNEHDKHIIIFPGSGNHIIRGTYQANYVGGTLLEQYYETPVTVKPGYSGIIRFEDTQIDVSNINGINSMIIESGANVILELTDDNTLFAGSNNGIIVNEGAVLIIESEHRGTLTIKGSNGVSVGGFSDGGTLVIRGNAVVDVSGGNGIDGGIWIEGTGYKQSNSKVIITGNAEVSASGYGFGGAGIGGGAGLYGRNGTLLIDGNAKVKAHSEYGAAIGGGSDQTHTGGEGGIITIGGNAQVTATSTYSTAIGGGRGGQNGHGGFSGIITIKDNACITAIGNGPYSGGIGGGPNHIYGGFPGGSFGCDIRILGGVINAASMDRGVAIGGSNGGPISVNITGGSVYTSKGVATTSPYLGANLYAVKLIVQDENGNNLDNIRLRLDNYYKVVTGKNSVWEGTTFSDELQQGVAYVWLPFGERSVEILNADGTFSPQSINVERNNNGVFIITLKQETPPIIAWTGAESDEWNASGNWQGGKKPNEEDIVLIPAPSENMKSFPVLKTTAAVSEIHFEPGAQLGGQHHLSANAFVQYDLRVRNRWQMLSIPLGEVYPSDFTFGGYPLTWVRTFKASSGEGGESVTKGVWETAQQSTKSFSFGDGFVLWLNNDNDLDNPVDESKGLKLLHDILELPAFQHYTTGAAKYDLYKNVNPMHDFDAIESKSWFFSYDLIKTENQFKFERGSNKYDVSRSENAYQLAKWSIEENFSKPYSFAGRFALIGNPYMAALDFVALTEGNKNVIKSSYNVWVDAGSGNGSGGYQTFSPKEGLPAGLITGDNSDGRLIAPLQGFIVAKPEGATSDAFTLLFKEESMTAVNKNAVLRSSGNNTNRLDIVARNHVARVRTFIAKRENGQTTFGNSDARKMINSISDIPEVYTLKTYKNGMIGTAINIINGDDLLIPIGLVTSYAGNITFTFSGMDSYDANLSLFDAETGRTIDLTGLATYDYTFNYVPKIVKNEATACENRFFIRISKSTTGLMETLAGKVNVFESNGFIQVISGASNPIKEVAVYDLQGALVYKAIAVNLISYTVGKFLTQGVYVVKVISEKGVENVKVVKR